MRYKNILFAWLVGGLGLLTLVWWPQADVAFEVPRVVAFQWWVIVLAVLGMWNWKQKIQFKMLILLLIWITILLLSSISTWQESWLGNYYRRDGLLTQLGLVILAICVGWSRVSSLKLLIVQVVTTSLWSSVVVVSWIWPEIHNWLPKSFWWGDGTIALTFGNPHLLAGYLVVSLAGLVGLKTIISKKYSLLMTLMIGIHLLAIAATQAYLIMGLSWIVITWRWLFEAKKRWIPIILTGIAIMGFLWWVFRPVNTFDAESRSRMWRRALMAWEQKPILGWGWAQFPRAIERVAWPFPVGSDVYVDKAHSSVVEVLVATGTLGFLICLLIWKQTLKYSTNRGWQLIVLAFLIMSQLNVVSISTEILGWMGMGLALTDQEHNL